VRRAPTHRTATLGIGYSAGFFEEAGSQHAVSTTTGVWRDFWGIPRGTPWEASPGADGVLAAEDSFPLTTEAATVGGWSPHQPGLQQEAPMLAYLGELDSVQEVP